MKKVALVCTVGLLLLSGCSMNTAQSRDIVETSYRSVVELRDAFISAGGSCESWVQKNQVTLAAESGTCNDSNVLSIYTSESVKDEALNMFKEIAADGTTLVVGPNWIVNDPSARDLDSSIGGVLVTL